MEVWVLPIGAVAGLILSRVVTLRGAKPLSPDEPIIGSATRTGQKPTNSGWFQKESMSLSIQATVTLAVLCSALYVLMFGAEDHPWRNGAQYALGIVIGFWLNTKSDKNR
jgi:hypothetical protein